MKRTYLSIIFIFVQIFVFSQSLLWKISDKNLEKPSYLYGTIHIQDAKVFSYDSTVIKAFNDCDAFAMEILMDEVDQKTMQEATLMKKTSLDRLLTKEQYNTLDSIFKTKFGIGLLLYRKMKPFFLSSLSTQAKASRDTKTALDLDFLEKARQQNKKCYGVEQFQDQIYAIDKLGTYKEQAEMLYAIMTDTAVNQEIELNKLIETYLAFDLQKMLQLSKEEDGFGANFEKYLIIDRNKRMAKNLNKIMKKQSCFCAVGAMHLPGDKGIIRLLENYGYTVEAVKFEWNFKNQ